MLCRVNAAELGLRLAKGRRRAGLSQIEIAKRLGTTQSAISRVEAGQVLPRIDFLDRWAQAVGEPLTITFGKPPPAPQDISTRVREALGGFQFDPWLRELSAAEKHSLEADGLSREHFRRARASAPRGD